MSDQRNTLCGWCGARHTIHAPEVWCNIRIEQYQAKVAERALLVGVLERFLVPDNQVVGVSRSELIHGIVHNAMRRWMPVPEEMAREYQMDIARALSLRGLPSEYRAVPQDMFEYYIGRAMKGNGGIDFLRI